jgi:PAS domain S-box-containing protein
MDPILRRWLQRAAHQRDLGVGMLILYLLFVGPVAIGAIAFDQIASQRLESDVRAADLALARAIALKTDAELSRALYTVDQLARYPEVIDPDPAAMTSLFEAVSVARPEVNLIYRLGPDGIMLFHYPVGPGSTVGTDFSFRPYFQAARDTLAPVVSKGRISPTTNQAVATTVMPIVVNGQFAGVVATNLRLESLSEALRAIASEHGREEGFNLSIVDSSGQIIADPEPTRLLEPLREDLPSVVNAVLAQQSDSLEGQDTSGQHWLNTYAPIPSAGWGVIVRRPTANAFRTAQAFHRGLLIALAVFLVAGLFFWLALSHRVIQPLEQLDSFSRLIGSSQPEPAGVRQPIRELEQRPDQIGHLSRSISEMDRSIQRRLRELEMLLETSGTVVSSLDLGIVLDRILEQTGRLLDANTCSIVAFDQARDEFRIQASRGLSPSYIRRLRIDPAAPNSPTMRAIRSGQPIQIEDIEVDPTFTASRPRARAEGYRALLAVPLLTQHASPAALLVYFAEPRRLREREVNMVMNFANHAAMAIENATLFAQSDEQLQEQTRRLESLIESMTDGLILEDVDGRILYCNRRMQSLAGLQADQTRMLSGRQVRQRLLDRCPDFQGDEQTTGAILAGHSGQLFELTLQDGSRATALRVQTFAVTDPAGTLLGRGQLFQDITDYRELDRMKNSLIATVSHELRTPLASIKGYASTLLADDVEWDPPTQSEFLGVISDEADRLSDLVTDLLDLSRIEAGNLNVDTAPCDLADLVADATRRARVRTEGRVKIDIPAGLPPLAVDRRRIEVVIRNLLENAAKYGGAQAEIQLRAEREDGHVVIYVSDTGPGIPSGAIDRVFDPFFRAEGGLARSASGAGLGLSISRGFIEAHGGRIWVEPGDFGTCIGFTLPLEDGG